MNAAPEPEPEIRPERAAMPAPDRPPLVPFREPRPDLTCGVIVLAVILAAIVALFVALHLGWFPICQSGRQDVPSSAGREIVLAGDGMPRFSALPRNLI